MNKVTNFTSYLAQNIRAALNGFSSGTITVKGLLEGCATGNRSGCLGGKAKESLEQYASSSVKLVTGRAIAWKNNDKTVYSPMNSQITAIFWSFCWELERLCLCGADGKPKKVFWGVVM